MTFSTAAFRAISARTSSGSSRTFAGGFVMFFRSVLAVHYRYRVPLYGPLRPFQMRLHWVSRLNCRKEPMNLPAYDSERRSFRLNEQSAGGRRVRAHHGRLRMRAFLTLDSARSTLGTHRKKKCAAWDPLICKSPNQEQMAPPRERRFEAEINASPCEGIDFTEHEPARMKGSGLRRERRYPLCYQVGIDEVPAVRVIRQEFSREGRLARAVWSGNDVKSRTHRFGTFLEDWPEWTSTLSF